MFSAEPLHRSHCVCVSITKSCTQKTLVKKWLTVICGAAYNTKRDRWAAFRSVQHLRGQRDIDNNRRPFACRTLCCQTAGYRSVRLRPQRYFRSQTSPSPYLSPPPTSFSSSRRRRRFRTSPSPDHALLIQQFQILHVKIMYLWFSMKKQGSLSCFNVVL